MAAPIGKAEIKRLPVQPYDGLRDVLRTGDLDAAWSAAVAGWMRAGGQPEGRQLRADLERFVTQTLIPERAQALTGQHFDAKPTIAEIATLTEEWRAVTGRWTLE